MRHLLANSCIKLNYFSSPYSQQSHHGSQHSSPQQNRPNAFQSKSGFQSPQSRPQSSGPPSRAPPFGAPPKPQVPPFGAPPKPQAPPFGAPPKPQVPPSGPPSAAPNNKRKVDEKAPNMAQMFKKVKCDSKKDAKSWEEEYEQRKKERMAAFNSKK